MSKKIGNKNLKKYFFKEILAVFLLFATKCERIFGGFLVLIRACRKYIHLCKFFCRKNEIFYILQPTTPIFANH